METDAPTTPLPDSRAGARSTGAAPPGRRSRLLRSLRDWYPVLVLGVAYRALHAAADPLVRHAHVEPQIRFDELIAGGTVPTVRLQEWLWDPSHLHWYDYAAWLVYLSHFVVTPVVAVVLWRLRRPLFLRFRTLMVTLITAGFVTYVLYPAVPPWLASDRGYIEPTHRIVHAVWEEAGAGGMAAVFGARSDYAYPVGALPSLHAAWPAMLMLFAWSFTRRWRPLLVVYTLAMAVTLVYSADHYVFDVLLGWAYAAVAYVIVERVRQRALRATAASSARTGTGSGARTSNSPTSTAS